MNNSTRAIVIIISLLLLILIAFAVLNRGSRNQDINQNSTTTDEMDNTNSSIDGDVPEVGIVMWAGPSNAGILSKQGSNLLVQRYEEYTDGELIVDRSVSGGSGLLDPSLPPHKRWYTPEGGIRSQKMIEDLEKLYQTTSKANSGTEIIGVVWNNGVDQTAIYVDETVTEEEYRTALYNMLTEWQQAAQAKGHDIKAFLVDAGTAPLHDGEDTARFREIEAEVFESHPIGVVATRGTTDEIMRNWHACSTDECRRQWFETAGRDPDTGELYDPGYGVHWGPGSVELIIEELAKTISVTAAK